MLCYVCCIEAGNYLHTPRLFEVTVLGGINLGDWKLSKSTNERANETFWQRAPLPTSDQQLCVTLAHPQTHTAKGEKGNRDNYKDIFRRANRVAAPKQSAVSWHKLFSVVFLKHVFFLLSSCREPHPQYGDILTSLLIILIKTPHPSLSLSWIS